MLLATGAVAISGWQAQLSRNSTAAHWIVLLLVGIAIVSAIVVGWSRQRETTRAWASGSARYLREWRSQPRSFVLSVVVWTVLIAGIVGWDLVSFIHQSHSLPTLSYFIGHVTRYRIGRGLLFALWLMAGWYLVSAWRARASR